VPRSADFLSPQHAFLKALSREKVEYLVVGVSGINYYAKDARQVISTMDYDVFIRPDAENLLRVVRAVLRHKCGLSYLNQDKKLVAIHKPNLRLCSKLAENKSVLLATGPYHTVYDLVQEISGFTYDQMRAKAVKLKDKKLGFSFSVGRLEDLLESKRRAGRPKDILFIKKFKDVLLNP